MDSPFPTQNIISMCPGIGGLERGLSRTSLPIRTICYVEIEAFIVANMVAQMEVGLLDAAPIWTNVKTFDGKPFRGMVHGICAGYPCQPFSHAGERRGTEDERHLFPYILEQIKVIGPEFVYFENVGGHLSMGYDEVRRSLSDIGYRVEEGIFTAEEVGAPHRRERLFILGVMENASILRWRRWCIGNQGRIGCEVQVEGSGTSLDYTNIERDDRRMETKGRRKSKSPVSNRELADSNSGVGIETSTSGRNRINKIKTICPSMDNSFQSRLEGHAGNDRGAVGRKRQERSITPPGLFPAGQGAYQHDWEEPRTVESSLVYTINGYNFTEDLHRAIGNSVVEQVAELAFITLLDKHIKNS